MQESGTGTSTDEKTADAVEGGFERRLDARLVMAVVAAGIMSFSGVVVETAMNVAFPSLMAEFDVSTSTVQWMTTGYLVVLAVIIPTSAYLKRRFPMRRIFVAAVALFLTGILIDATAPSFAVLLAGRLIQGVGTGIALPLMFNIILDQSPMEHMGLMIGIGSLVTAIAPAVGPSVGGVIIQAFSWRMVFVLLVPLLVVSLVMGLASIRQATPVGPVRLDWPGEALLACCFACLIVALSTGVSQGVTIAVAAFSAVGVTSGVAFVWHTRRCDHPLIDLAVLGRRGFALTLSAIMLFQLVILALGYIIPNYSQLVCGEGSAVAGSLMLPGCLVGACLAPVSGRILDALGARRPILAGNLLALASCVLFCVFSSRLDTPLFIGFYLMFTLGQGLCYGCMTTNGLSFLPAGLKADGNAAINTGQQLAGAVGTSLATGFVAAAQAGAADVAQGTMAGASNAFVALVVCSVGVVVFSLAALRCPKRDADAEDAGVADAEDAE
ncbi:MAG: DHA2 family efflux MFS transporter permease subunit [Atopobiaceae bacterium]|jgi:EmrB/QacA subfamily drug resistance transporter|nr:DHA2 family efflux MFS transporter permease subunit [Atopobiaceae bacterium]MCI2172611.1 DHA2 family efflux MFS transporter permease subunit [Atopobiaceae bacterium]MCI2206918.1 DHA2 family efflux MFS transporter permease subunit [Atopobiaceae bacterium]